MSRFPNLARGFKVTDQVLIAEVTSIADAELVAAGVTPCQYDFPIEGEVPTRHRGTCGPWIFERRWYYWSAKGPGLPIHVSIKLHESHGKEVRVDGHCGAPHPLEYCKGFAVGLYHIDSPEGLRALAMAIMSVNAESALSSAPLQTVIP